MRALVLPFLFLFACGDAPSDAGGSSRPAPLVRVASVEAGTLTEQWLALGEVRPLEAAQLAAGASGPVVSVAVREGAEVGRGDVLVEIDRAPALARLAGADARAREADIEHRRLAAALARREAVSAGVLSSEELVDARSRVDAQEARLAGLQAAADEARADLSRHRVRAPFAGVVTGRSVAAGDWVTVAQPLLTLVSTADLEVHVRVPRRVARALTVGATATLAGGTATVAAIVPAVDPDTRTVLVRLTPDADVDVAAGEAVDVALPVPWTDVGVKVPRDALLLQPGAARVIKIEGEVTVAVPVEVLATADEAALVTGEGLAVGDQVVTRGNERVRPGGPVRLEAEPAAP
jgi:RND family efflux transporter MFP subunit